jgi:ubiquinone/menaquinone biosynthesis C-methylase UbiE
MSTITSPTTAPSRVDDDKTLKAPAATLEIQQQQQNNDPEEKKDDEREVWEFMTPMAWHKSVASTDSIFRETYQATRDLIEETARRGGYDVIVEVGCGTGDVIGEMSANVKVPRIGLDINQEFIKHCVEHHKHPDQKNGDCEFHVADALHLVEWWSEMGLDKKFKKPLVTCVNNTLNIMPEHLRAGVVAQMLKLAGDDGMCMASYWNGNFFSHAIMNYYKKNAALCGKFELHDGHVDWEHRVLVTPTNYSTEWHLPAEVRLLFRSMDVDVPNLEKTPKWGQPHLFCAGMAIFCWFDHTSTSNAKNYYDSDDAQKFYSKIWGEDTLHVGRYDLIDETAAPLSSIQRVAKAQELHELEFVKLIQAKTQNHTGTTDVAPLRVVDMGCGYGGMLRRLHKEGLVWRAVGVDISGRMCAQARRQNAKMHIPHTSIEILEQSYLDIGVPDESADLVISMDALLHVGPERQRAAVAEAARILRPGGWMIFSDIMQEEQVESAEAMEPIYKRINLSKMGTISNYQTALEECGLHNFTTDLHSANIATHYGSVLEVLQEKGPEFEIASEFQATMEEGLTVWKTKSPGNIVWGLVAAQKTEKVRKLKKSA